MKIINNLVNRALSLIPESKEVTPVTVVTQGLNKSVVAGRVQSLMLPSPMTPEDEGFNDGIEAAVKKIMEM